LFLYSQAIPSGGSPVSTVNIDYSNTSNVTWRYNATTKLFQRYYNSTTPDLLKNGVQNKAANVVVQYVQVSYGPWLENSEGGLEVQADLYPDASGTAEIYRNGQSFAATWHRSTLASPTQFVNAVGQVIPLQPGPTWVELVPSNIIAATTP
jgi:hypothetical protein